MHKYLHFTSSHPNHTKRSIVYSQGLRVKRICSEKEDFLKHMREIKLWFLKRDYPENIADHELGKVVFSESSQWNNKRDKGVCLIATYYPLLQNTGKTFYRHFDLLYILIKKLEGFLHLVRWLCFVVQGKLAAI